MLPAGRRRAGSLLTCRNNAASRWRAHQFPSRPCATAAPPVVAPPPPAGAPASPAPPPPAAKPPRTDWYYIGVGAALVAVIGAPLLFIAELQDSPDFRQWVGDVAPAALALAHDAASVPYNDPAGYRESAQPKGDDAIDVAVVIGTDVVAVRARARDSVGDVLRRLGRAGPAEFAFPTRAVSDTGGDEGEGDDGGGDDLAAAAAARLAAGSFAPPLARPLRSPHALWSLENAATLEEEAFELQDAAAALCAEVAELDEAAEAAAASGPPGPRPLVVAAAQERLERVLARRREAWRREDELRGRPQLTLEWAPRRSADGGAEVAPGVAAGAPPSSSWRRWLPAWLGGPGGGGSGSALPPPPVVRVTTVADAGDVVDVDDLLGDVFDATPVLSAVPPVEAGAARSGVFFEGPEAASVPRRLRTLALRRYVAVEGDAALDAAFRAAGVERHAKTASAPVTLGSLLGFGGGGGGGAAVAAAPAPPAEAPTAAPRAVPSPAAAAQGLAADPTAVGTASSAPPAALPADAPAGAPGA